MTGPGRRAAGVRSGTIRVLGTLVAAATVAVLAACTGLPTSGPIIAGRAVDEPEVHPIKIVPQGPVDGMTRTEIAAGFVRAGAGFQENSDGPNVAQEFLAPPSAQNWRPTSQVTIVAPDVTATQLPNGSVQVKAKATATVSADGRYVELPPGSTASVTMGMTQVSGQWRAILPSGFGLWLTAIDFERLFQPVGLYFGATGSATLVADGRWLPSGSGLATSIASAVLAGVPDYLSGAVRTGFPSDAALAVDSVTVQQGVATVQLNDTVLNADEPDRRLMYAQLLASLLQDPPVSSVVIAVGRSQLQVAGRSSPVSALSQVGYAEPPSVGVDFVLLRSGTKLTSVSPASLGSTSPTSSSAVGGKIEWPAVPTSVKSLALARSGTVLAGIGGEGATLQLWQGGAAVTVSPFASALTRPSFDPAGYVWVGGTSDGSTGVWVVSPAARDRAQRVTALWLSGRRIVSLRVSPDGSRAAVISTNATGGEVRLDVAGIVRDSAGVPRTLDNPLQQADPLSDMEALTWLDSTSLVVVGRLAGSDVRRPFVALLGDGIGLRDGSEALLPPLPSAVSIESVGGVSRLIATGSDGRVRLLMGSDWQVLATEAVVVPGQ